jgi:DNA-binding LacI/PurR family transcriptional regulator
LDAARAERRPTLETVAARAGVSRSLVSLVLRGSPKVSPGRREAVMRAVAELGYRPNAAARLLAEQKSNTVGVLLNDLRQPWLADMLDGLTPALHAGGKAILLGDGRIDRMMDEALTWSFLDLGVGGLVLAGSFPVTSTITNVARQIPTVAVGGLDPDLPHVDVLVSDNHLGGTLAVRHLLEFGHRRIAHISGLPSAAGRLRLRAYQDALRVAGLGEQVLVEAGDMTEEGGYRAAVRLLSRAERPTAIFAANDLSCIGALSAAAALGVLVPGELSLVGFDNSSLARLRALWLTSVDGAACAMGQQAARMLLARIEHPDTPRETTLMPPRLEVRGSSGPAPSGRLPAFGGIGECDAGRAQRALPGGPGLARYRAGRVERHAHALRDRRARPAQAEQRRHRDGDATPVADLLQAGRDGRADVDRVVDDGHPPAADPAGHRGQAIPGHLFRPPGGRAVARQEGCPQPIGERVGEERAAVQGPAHRVGRLVAQPLGQPADVRAQQGGAQQQRVEIQPDIPVVSGAQVEMPRPGPGQLDDLSGFHPAMMPAAGASGPVPGRMNPGFHLALTVNPGVHRTGTGELGRSSLPGNAIGGTSGILPGNGPDLADMLRV